VWIGRTRLQIEDRVAKDDVDDYLRWVKKTWYFRDRTDVTVAAGAVPFQELIDVISAAKRVGFSDVGLATPDAAFARYALY
jgi:biopolymer transport protein ExbD